EYKIKEIIDQNAPIDAFGIGTELATSSDDPTISGVYKLIEYGNKSKIKISEEKITFPGKKQVFRVYDKTGEFKEDILALEDEPEPEKADALLEQIIKSGKLITKLPEIDEIRQFYLQNIERLPQSYRNLENIHVTNLRLSSELDRLTNSLIKKYQ
ncbi:MAG: nicotinate phosphoribosyltransferase, partial [Candidatus Thorarchaeota archaeon]